MPLIIEGGRVPTSWAEKGNARRVVPIGGHIRRDHWVSLALINNMPDPALEDTELQFFELLDIASGDVPVVVKLYSLRGIPRTDRGQCHLNSFYFDIDDLWDNRFDGVIMTGTEPKCPDLRDEPYWPLLTQVLDWAERNTSSTVLSCLAAHAGVLHSDGITRHPLPDKQFGVFEFARVSDHHLIRNAGPVVKFPHSRWNEVQENSLTACGYEILTKSGQGGVDVFVKEKKNSLFVHFQGHPEYGAQTLFKEYRRDIRRFLRQERETYPTMPYGYFGSEATNLLVDFQRDAIANPGDERLKDFPETVANALRSSWESYATCVYRNWLRYVVTKKTEAPLFAALPGLHTQSQRKRSAIS